MDKALMQAAAINAVAEALENLKKLGLNVESVFGKPPNADVEIVEEVIEDVEASLPEEFKTPAVPEGPGRPKPGSYMLDKDGKAHGWVPWTRHDLNRDDTVQVTPEPIPSLIFPLTDDEGRQKLKLDVNDLVCFMTVGVPQTVNRFFYNAYMDAYRSWRELEMLKRNGPGAAAPWGEKTSRGEKAWLYTPAALSFAITETGGPVATRPTAVQSIPNPE